MNLLHAWFIPLGVAAALLPVAIHFLTRPRPTRLPLSTLRFVRRAVEQRRSHSRLRDAIVLMLRTAAILLLAWAIARPLSGDRASDEGSDAAAVRIVVLDVSQSMAAVDRSVRAFERARAAAATQLVFRPGLKLNLILAGATPQAVLDRPSTNVASMEEELARSAPRAERLNLPAALELAASMLAVPANAEAPEAQQRELVIVSDFQRSNWATADFAALPQGTRIRLESVAPPTAPANVAILRAGRGQGEGPEAALEVEVGNFSTAQQNVQVEVDLDDATFRLEGICPAGSRITLVHPLAGLDPGWHLGAARRLGPADALEADDTRPVVVDVRRAPRYGLVTRQSPRQRPSSSYFLERALVPTPSGVPSSTTAGDGRPQRASVVRIDAQQLDLDKLSAIDLLVFDHPGKLSQETVRMVASLVRRGKSMLYIASESVDASNLSLLADAASSDWQLAVKFAPLPTARARTPVMLADLRRDARPFSVFGDELMPLLAPIKFVAGVATQAAPDGLADSVIASYSDRSASLAEGAWGAGQFAVWNVDLQASNLGTSPIFVPLVQELAAYLLAPSRAASDAPSGETTALYLPPETASAEGLRLIGPNSSASPGTLVDEGTSVLWRLERDAPPGVYEVRRDDQTLFAAAVALPAEECDLASLGADVFQQRLAGGRDVRFRALAGATDDGDDRWVWLLVACVGCMLSEVVALGLFRT